MKNILLVALTALALGLASIGGGAPALASIRAGTGDFHTDPPALGASKPTNGGDIWDVGVPALAGGRVITGDPRADMAAPAIAASRPNSGGDVSWPAVAASRPSSGGDISLGTDPPVIAGGLSGGVIANGA